MFLIILTSCPCLVIFLIPVSCSCLACLFCIRCSCVSSVSFVFVFSACCTSVGHFSFCSVTPPPSFISTLKIVSFWSFFYVSCRSDFLVLTLFLCSRRLLSCLTFLYFVISDYLAIEPLLVVYEFCLGLLNLGFCTLCIWVPPSLSLPITIYNTRTVCINLESYPKTFYDSLQKVNILHSSLQCLIL